MLLIKEKLLVKENMNDLLNSSEIYKNFYEKQIKKS